MTTIEKIAVMQAYADGKKIQCKPEDVWIDWRTMKEPIWDWRSCEYRIKPELKEPTYVPFENVQEFLEASSAHGPYIVNNIGIAIVPVWHNGGELFVGNKFLCDVRTMLRVYKWQDGTPCGKLKEE